MKTVNLNKTKIIKGLGSVGRFILLLGMSYILLYPLIYMVSMSLRDISDLSDSLVVWIPRNFTFDNVVTVFKAMRYPTAFLNTIMLCIVSALLSVVSCGIVGYGFARFEFPLKKFWFMCVVLTILVPIQTTLIPMTTTMRYFDFMFIGQFGKLFSGQAWTVNLLGTPLSMYIPAVFASGIKSGLFIFIYRQFFMGLPKELEDAAYLDGCGPIKTFIKVMLPLASGAIIVVVLLSVVVYWNDDFYTRYFFDNLVTLRSSLASLATGIKEIMELENVDTAMQIYSQVGAMLFIAPPLIFFIVFQRFFTESVERAGIVG